MVGEVGVAITPGCLLGKSLGEEKGEWLIPELRSGDQGRYAADGILGQPAVAPNF